MDYVETRHNIGFDVLDVFAARHQAVFHTDRLAMVSTLKLKGRILVLVKPTTFMNLSGASVLEAVRFHKLDPASDLLVLDLMMPRLGGLEVLKALRARGRATPILLLTAKATELDRVLGLELGADDYLTKPFELPELEARVRALTGSAASRSTRRRRSSSRRRRRPSVRSPFSSTTPRSSKSTPPKRSAAATSANENSPPTHSDLSPKSSGADGDDDASPASHATLRRAPNRRPRARFWRYKSTARRRVATAKPLRRAALLSGVADADRVRARCVRPLHENAR